MTQRQTPLVPLGSSVRNLWHVSAQEVDLVRDAPPPPQVAVAQDGERRIQLDINRTALIVIDMQNDFCHPDGWLGHIGVDVTPARAPIEPLRRLLPALREAEMPVVWLNWGNRADRLNLSPALLHVYKPTGEGVGLGDPLPLSGEPVLESGSWAAAVVDELAPWPEDIRVNKYRMSGFKDTELDSILRNLNVTTLLFAGVNADQCVLCTLQDANFHGYDCLLLEDCCATTSPQYCMDATLYNVRQCFGFVIDSEQLVSQLAG
ncbi:isochorismatase [Rouxiella silvae]|uniref:Isochorismatase n=1 Tax=Rouxiella silvae TaxID=1646373 RepID=A0ABX3U328_9GAMM|nr:cysteine hydrolase [Rouxiella silvae]ORJ21946.1 isochorismatase [Rouxiella silvae]